MIIENGSKLVIMGDSITDCGREKPLAENFGAGSNLGNGYANLVKTFIRAYVKDYNIKIVNGGIGGDTSRWLKDRWQTDCLDLNPDWISIMIGTNDVWRQFDLPDVTHRHVYIDEYKANLEEIIEKSLKQVKGIILLTPFYLELNKADPMRAKIAECGKVVKELSRKYNTLFLDTQALFDDAMQRLHTQELAGDRVHPNIVGHSILAKAFLETIGIDIFK